MNQALAAWRRSLYFVFFLLGIALAGAAAQTSALDPLPQDTGVSGLKQTIRELETTGRLLQVVAHPDDEDGGMLTLEARGKGISTTLMTLTRGEGGQNKVGSSLFDVLGVLRTLELTAADRYYGVQQRFSRVADYGFSKTPEEAFQKWGGHDTALADIVRVIRTFRPDVLVARFSGTNRDGHGHHQASSILAQEAFRAAADPNRFPEQIKEGLQPWQAKKLYIGNVCGFGASSCPDENYTVKLNTGVVDPALGKSYIQFAMDGLRHQLSQGAGGWSVEPGDRWTFYKLADSAIGSDKSVHEKDFFDGVKTDLASLVGRLGPDPSSFPTLKQALSDIADKIQKADSASDHPEQAATPLLEALALLDAQVKRLEETDLGPGAADVLSILREKQKQCEQAAILALGVSVEAKIVPVKGPGSGIPSEAEARTMISPGQTVPIIAKFHNGSKQIVEIQDAEMHTPSGFAAKTYKSNFRTLQPGEDFYANFQVTAGDDAPLTRPHWHRSNPETDSINTIDQKEFQTLPFPPPPLWVEVKYSVQSSGSKLAQLTPKHTDKLVEGRISVPLISEFVGENGASVKRAVAVVPAYSVMLEPGEQVIPVGGDGTRVKVSIVSNLAASGGGKLHLVLPAGWRSEPEELPVELRRGDKQDFEFQLTPSTSKEGRADIQAVLEARGKTFAEGYSLVTREDLDSFYYYQPADQHVSVVDVKVPKGLKVGYIMGAGDDIPAVLQQIGIDVALVPAEKLADEDLTKFGTIVLGIRAYDTQKDVAANNKKLLDYVSGGGTLVVQYNAGVGDFNSGHFTPYPMQIGRSRVSVEEAPMEVLAADDSIFHIPNEISQRDFQGWVQERGLNFADQWDDHFKPLLASHDPGEQPLKGGMLRAQYGKGTYIFTGYAFFRQLPAGVPGAIRLFVNLLNAGH